MAKLTILAKMERNGQKSQNGHAKNHSALSALFALLKGKCRKCRKCKAKNCMRIVRILRNLTFLSVFFKKGNRHLEITR